MESKKTETKGHAMKEIKNPKKDFHLYAPPICDIEIVKGVPVSIPAVFMQNMKTEGVT